MIKRANEIPKNEKYKGLLYGPPGVSKSTTALSAPNPLMIDCDRGWTRIPAQFRTGAYIQPVTYDEVLEDLRDPAQLREYETIIFDTCGALLELMKPWAIKQNPKNGQRDGTTLSMQGYGTVGKEFARLAAYCHGMNKHVIYVAHSKEKQDGDITTNRLDIEGSTKDAVWKVLDFGGFIEPVGENRSIGFSPVERYFAKGARGITGTMLIPNVMKGAPNTFIADLFHQMDAAGAEEMVMAQEYNKLMDSIKKSIELVTDAKTATECLSMIETTRHIFASKTEAKYLLADKTKSLGLTYDKAKAVFVAKGE